jgi:hypothetical protein
MTEKNSEMSTPFTEVVTNKIQKHAEQIAGMQEKLMVIPDVVPDLIEIKKQLTDIKVAITAIKFPIKQMEDLSKNLVANAAMLKQPVENKVLHHHHVHKIIIITASIFVMLCLTFCGWYNTAEKLDQYRATDFKYRYLKLKNNPALHQLLAITDSLYQTNPEFVNAVLHGEDSIRNLIQKMVNTKEKEVKDLKRKMK